MCVKIKYVNTYCFHSIKIGGFKKAMSSVFISEKERLEQLLGGYSENRNKKR